MRCFLSFFIFLCFAWNGIHAQTVRILSDNYKISNVSQKVWVNDEHNPLNTNQSVQKVARLHFSPGSSISLNNYPSKDVRKSENSTKDSVLSEYACMLPPRIFKAIDYRGLIDAAVSVQAQSSRDDSEGIHVVFFDIEDLEGSKNKNVTVSIAHNNNPAEGTSFHDYSKSRKKSFKKQDYIYLIVSNKSDKPLYADVIITQKDGNSSSLSLTWIMNDDNDDNQFIVVPVRDEIVIVTDIVVWSKVSLSLLTSEHPFVVYPNPNDPNSFRCSTLRGGTKSDIYNNTYSF